VPPNTTALPAGRWAGSAFAASGEEALAAYRAGLRRGAGAAGGGAGARAAQL